MSNSFSIKVLTSAVAIALLGACSDDATNKSEQSSVQSEQVKSGDVSSASAMPSDDANSSNKATLEYNIFNKEDTAGTMVVERNGGLVKAHLQLGWNNRKVDIEEVFTVNEKGFIVEQSVKGISAFGAPIDEQFSIKDGVARWKSTSEEGQAASDGDKFYIASDGSGPATDFLIQTLLEDDDNKIDLLPSGTASLVKLKSLTLEKEGVSKTVHLMGITGIGFTPNFLWYDDDNTFFATDGGGWFGIISKGWGREHLEQLSEVQKEADNDFLKRLANELTYTAEGAIVVSNVNYVDVVNGEFVEGKTILIESGVIKAIDSALPEMANATHIDAQGKTLIPGLWDMHGHLSKSDGLLNIPAGVTNVRDMGNTHDNIIAIERMSEANEIMGGDVYRAGFMDRESPYAMKMGKTIDSLEAAKDAVDWYAERGYPQIKTYSSMEPQWVPELAEHIHSKGMRLSGHIPAFMTAEEAVRGGFDEIQHINMLFLNFLGKNIDTRQRLRFTLVGEKAHTVDLESQEVADFIALLKEKDTVIDATLSTFRNLLLAKAGSVNPEVAEIHDHLPVNIARGYKKAILDIKDSEREDYNKSAEALGAMIKKLHDSGVQIVPGTDEIAGFTLQQELIDYNNAGIAPMDVLQLATIGSAKVVNQEDNVGSITVGKQADLVFIDGNPLEDMESLRRVALVIKGQRIYKPQDIYEAIGVKPFVKALDFEK